MKINGKSVKIFDILLRAAAILAVFGVSFGAITQRGREVWRAPQEINSLKNDVKRRDSIIVKQNYAIHDLEDAQEMFYQLLRLMTDDHDTEKWKIVIEGDIEYSVDIRSTSEGIELAFVDNMNMVYRAYIDYADVNQRKYILRHHNGGNKATYIEPQ